MKKVLDTGLGEAHTGDMSATPIPPTAKQISFIKSLLDELRDKYGDDSLRAPLNEAFRTQTLTRENASGTIEALIAVRDYNRSQAPRTAPVAPKAAQVAVTDGHYALDRDGVVKFYSVRNGAEGSKWEGFTFVDAEASDERHPIKNRQSRDEILSLIAAAPLDAMKLYGREIGVCGHCGRALTSDWRKVGIGPVCSQKYGA